MAAIWAWIQANPATTAAIVLAIYAFATGKITITGLIQQIIDDFRKKPVVPVTPVPGPTPDPGPVPVPDTFLTLLQQLIALLKQARAADDKVQEEAVLTLLNRLSTAQKPS